MPLSSPIARFCRMAAPLVAAALLVVAVPAKAQEVVRIFAGPFARSEAFRDFLKSYSERQPAVKLEIVGGETLNDQRDFLGKALAAAEPMADLALVDALRPAQWAALKWIEPLDSHLGNDRAALIERYLPASIASATIGGKIVALPFVADAQLLFFRKDLFEKHGQKVPQDWAELKAALQAVLAAENQRNLRGFAIAGGNVESTTCAYLASLWGAGSELVGAKGFQADDPAHLRVLSMWDDLRNSKILPPESANYQTDEIRHQITQGALVAGLGWGYMGSRFQSEADSRVAGKIGIANPPGFSPGSGAGCIGGWHVAVVAASPVKTRAVDVARFLSSLETAKILAIKTGALPVFQSLYTDPEVLAAQAWFAEVLPVITRAKPRPASPRYSEISEIVRGNFHAFLAGTRTAEAMIADMKSRFELLFR